MKSKDVDCQHARGTYVTGQTAEEAKKRFLHFYPECAHRTTLSEWPVTV